MSKSIIKLKNVSKFYYNQGVIASGFTKLNVEFNIGEFVAITGESGSGKSTLLNVISGLDTYEEGQLYINGEETDHYGEKDFENYRRKYIGNIFQNFNLVNSYTVYQNIELVLLLNGNRKREIKKHVLELIDEVGLTKFKNTKVSKLSGGQKQRVAIARAIAKDTPIIIADEPTGNLDSKSAEEIIKILSNISKNKLVIIVTHNYDQVEKYVTRKIRMHDGKILEDKVLKKIDTDITPEVNDYKDIRFLSKIRLGIRNTFNILPKFLLLLAVYLFMAVSLISEYSAFKKQEYISKTSGYNYFFNDTSINRIVIKKQDKSSFTPEDYEKIKKLDNISSLTTNDLLEDTTMGFSRDDLWLYGTVKSIANLEGKLDRGKIPENANEIVIEGSKDDYYLSLPDAEILNKEVYLEDYITGEQNKATPLKIVGIKYTDSDSIFSDHQIIYVSENLLDSLSFKINERYSTAKVLFNNKYYPSSSDNPFFKIVPTPYIEKGRVYISADQEYLCPKYNCSNNPLKIEISNINYTDYLDLTVSKTYTSKNIASLLNITDFESYNGNIFINHEDYNRLFNKSSYQSSVYVKDADIIDSTAKELNDLGYTTLKIKDTLISDETTQLLKILRTVVTLILVVVLFFISYFVIQIILKSRNVYFTTTRMLGATKRISKELLIIELLNVANLAYFITLLLAFLTEKKILKISFVNIVLEFLTLKDFIILYIILMFISLLISIKFSKKLFKNSAMKTMLEEV